MSQSDKQVKQLLISKLEKGKKIQVQIQDQQRLSDQQNKHHYDSYKEYVVSLMGFAVGFGSFWRFPYLIYKNGGGVFFIPYILALVILGIPLLFLETIVGQMHQRSIPFIYNRINKGLKMVGTTFVIVCFHFAGYYNIVLAYAYRFLFSAFNYQLPYANQSSLQNTYFVQVVLHKSNGIDDFKGINFPLFFLYIISMVICYFIIRKGVKTSGKIVMYTALLPYLFFLILGIRAFFLQGAVAGLQYLFEPKWEKLYSSDIWIDAIVQVFFQMTIACSGIVNLSSLKPKKQRFIQGIYLIPLSLIVCGLLCALNIFMYLGHFCSEIGYKIQDLTLSGPELSFNVFPKALSILPWPNLWVLMFFTAMILLGIDSQFGALQSIFCYLKDEAKHGPIRIFNKQIQLHQAKKCVIYLILIFCPFLTSYAGIYYMQFLDTFVALVPFSAGALIEVYTFVYYMPFSQLEKQALKYTGTVTPYWIKYLLQGKVLIIILICNLSLATINQLRLIGYYSSGFYIIGWTITLYPYFIALIYWYLYRENKSRRTFEQLKKVQEFI